MSRSQELQEAVATIQLQQGEVNYGKMYELAFAYLQVAEEQIMKKDNFLREKIKELDEASQHITNQRFEIYHQEKVIANLEGQLSVYKNQEAARQGLPPEPTAPQERVPNGVVTQAGDYSNLHAGYKSPAWGGPYNSGGRSR